MKDKQIAPASAEPSIFLVSAFLHFVSMTALVYLRYSFGYAFLRPKSVFFAFSWAFILYAIYAWIDGSAWQRHRAMLLFGCGSVILYWLHFAIAFRREWRGGGEHDRYGGRSWIDWLARLLGRSSALDGEGALQLWGEPVIVASAAMGVRLLSDSASFAGWLFLTAGCLWAKSAINHWLNVRHRKRQRDAFQDMEDSPEPPGMSGVEIQPSLSPRKPRVERPRAETRGKNLAD